MSEKEQPLKKMKKMPASDLVTPDPNRLIENPKVPTRRVKMLMVKPADFMFLFTKGLVWRRDTRIVKGIPDDAVLISVAADSVRNGIMLVVESQSYEEVPINVLPPVEVTEIQIGHDNRVAPKKKTDRKKKK